MEKKINVFVLALPTFDDVVEKIKDAIEEAFDKPNTNRCFCCDDEDDDDDEVDFTPSHLRVNKPCGNVQPWGVAGKPADENLRFGAEFAVDEPRCEDYDDREDFEYDHMLYDEFVSCGETCAERGLTRPEGVTAHRCEAIRQPLSCPPPVGRDFIGETHWWECIN